MRTVLGMAGVRLNYALKALRESWSPFFSRKASMSLAASAMIQNYITSNSTVHGAFPTSPSNAETACCI